MSYLWRRNACGRIDFRWYLSWWVPKDEFDKKGLRRISYQEWHSIGNSSILLGQTKIPNAFLCKKYNKVIGVFDVRKTFSHYEAVTL